MSSRDLPVSSSHYWDYSPAVVIWMLGLKLVLMLTYVYLLWIYDQVKTDKIMYIRLASESYSGGETI